MFFLTLAGLGVSIFLAYNHPNTAYFLLPARLFELSLGAVLALFWDKIPNLSKTMNHMISGFGLLLIILPAIILNKTSIFPGINALYPCLGAVLIIFQEKIINIRVL